MFATSKTETVNGYARTGHIFNIRVNDKFKCQRCGPAWAGVQCFCDGARAKAPTAAEPRVSGAPASRSSHPVLLSVWTGAAAGGGAASCRWVDQPQERPVAGRTAGVGGAALAMGSIPGGVASCGISALAMASPLPFNRAASQPGSRGWGWAASRGRGCAALGQPLAPAFICRQLV